MQILLTEDLCGGNDVFFAATGVSNGDLLKGVAYGSGGATTNSIVMRSKSGTVRYINTHHRWHQTLPTMAEMEQKSTRSAILDFANRYS